MRALIPGIQKKAAENNNRLKKENQHAPSPFREPRGPRIFLQPSDRISRPRITRIPMESSAPEPGIGEKADPKRLLKARVFVFPLFLQFLSAEPQNQPTHKQTQGTRQEN